MRVETNEERVRRLNLWVAEYRTGCEPGDVLDTAGVDAHVAVADVEWLLSTVRVAAAAAAEVTAGLSEKYKASVDFKDNYPEMAALLDAVSGLDIAGETEGAP